MGVLSAIKNWRLISPRVKATKTRLEICPVPAGGTDWIIIFIILTMGLAAVVLTTDDVSYRLVGGGLYGYMAWTLVSDEFVTVLDKGSKEVRVTKSTLGWVRWVRVAPADELVAVEVTEEKRKGGASGYRIELEFMSEHGYYRLFTSETYVLGATNRTSLVALESQIREFMGLKQLPDWMKEENLDNVQKRHERREENAKKK